MVELLLAAGVLLVLTGLSLCALFLPWGLLLTASILATLLGLALGVPSGVYYHVALRRELLRLERLERGWYWRPHIHHEALDELGRKRVIPWWVVGASSFAVVILGAALSVVALATAP